MINKEKVAAAMHDAYETEAAKVGWVTNPKCCVPFEQLPSENVQCMLASSDAAINEILDQLTEEFKFPVMLRKMWSGGDVQRWIDERLHQIKASQEG